MSNLEIVPTGQEVREYHAPVTLRKQLSLTELWEIFMRLKSDMSRSHLLHYRLVGNRFCAFVGNRELTPILLEEWTLDLRATKKPNGDLVSGAYVNELNSKVKSFLRWMADMGHLTRDISGTVRRVPQVGPKEARMFTEKDYETIKAWAMDKPSFQTHLWLIILGYRTGMSLVDCCHLRWCQVHMNDNEPSYIKIPRMKNARHGDSAICYIPLIPGTDVWDWLLKMRKAERYVRFDSIEDYVAQDAPGLYVCTFSRIHRDFNNMVLRSGITPGLTFRNLRNSFCSNLVNSEVQIALICKMTGHQNVKTLLRYVKPDTQALQDGLLRAFQAAARTMTVNTNLGTAKA